MKAYAVLCSALLFAATPAICSETEAEVKQAVTTIATSIANYYSKKDSAGIASHFARGGVVVNPAGAHDVVKYFEGGFKAGFDNNEIAVEDAWLLNADTIIAVGRFKLTGKNESGSPLLAAGHWTSVDIREGGQWKIRMLTSAPQPPKPN